MKLVRMHIDATGSVVGNVLGVTSLPVSCMKLPMLCYHMRSNIWYVVPKACLFFVHLLYCINRPRSTCICSIVLVGLGLRVFVL